MAEREKDLKKVYDEEIKDLDDDEMENIAGGILRQRQRPGTPGPVPNPGYPGGGEQPPSD